MTEQTRFVVCAACKHVGTGLIIPGPRHFDETMRALIEAALKKDGEWPRDFEEGFIDQHGVFMDREEAMLVARKARQFVDVWEGCGGNQRTLYSEGLY